MCVTIFGSTLSTCKGTHTHVGHMLTHIHTPMCRGTHMHTKLHVYTYLNTYSRVYTHMCMPSRQKRTFYLILVANGSLLW